MHLPFTFPLQSRGSLAYFSKLVSCVTLTESYFSQISWLFGETLPISLPGLWMCFPPLIYHCRLLFLWFFKVQHLCHLFDNLPHYFSMEWSVFTYHLLTNNFSYTFAHVCWKPYVGLQGLASGDAVSHFSANLVPTLGIPNIHLEQCPLLGMGYSAVCCWCHSGDVLSILCFNFQLCFHFFYFIVGSLFQCKELLERFILKAASHTTPPKTLSWVFFFIIKWAGIQFSHCIFCFLGSLIYIIFWLIIHLWALIFSAKPMFGNSDLPLIEPFRNAPSNCVWSSTFRKIDLAWMCEAGRE